MSVQEKASAVVAVTAITPEPEAKKAKSHAEVGRDIAQYLLKQGSIRYVRDMGWIVWKPRKGVWKLHHGRDSHLVAEHEIIQLLEMKKRGGRQVVGEALAYLKACSAKDPKEIDVDKTVWINLMNGMYCLETGVLEAHKLHKQRFSTIQLPYSYVPGAKAPRWMQYLRETLRPDTHEMVQEFFGSLLVGNAHRFGSRLWFATGTGRNGKSVFARVAEEFVGKDNCSAVSITGLGDKFQRIDLYNKLLNISSESGIATVRGSEHLKSLSGGDTISAQYKFGGTINFINQAALFFTMNSIPAIPDATRAMTERIIVLLFGNTFYGDDADPSLVEKLIKELSGIFNWALIGLKHLSERGHFLESDSALCAKKEFLDCTNPLIKFAEKCLIPDVLSECSASDIRILYENYCSQNRINPRYTAQIVSHLCEILRPPRWRVSAGRVAKGIILKGARLCYENRNEALDFTSFRNEGNNAM